MNWKITVLLIIIVASLIICSVEGAKTKSKKAVKSKVAKSASPVAKTMCQRYANVSKVTQEVWVTGIIMAVEKTVTNPKQDLAQYFNGTTPVGSRNFVDPNNRDLLHQLTVRLVAFFGELLGCDDSNFPAFHKSANFRRIHHRMQLSAAQFSSFNAAVATAMKTAGVSQADVNSFTLNSLNPFRSKIVFQKRVPYDSITGFPPRPSAAAGKQSSAVKSKAKGKSKSKKAKGKSKSKKAKKSKSKKAKKSK